MKQMLILLGLILAATAAQATDRTETITVRRAVTGGEMVSITRGADQPLLSLNDWTAAVRQVFAADPAIGEFTAEVVLPDGPCSCCSTEDCLRRAKELCDALGGKTDNDVNEFVRYKKCVVGCSGGVAGGDITISCSVCPCDN